MPRQIFKKCWPCGKGFWHDKDTIAVARCGDQQVFVCPSCVDGVQTELVEAQERPFTEWLDSGTPYKRDWEIE